MTPCPCLNKATDDVELVAVVGHHPDCPKFQAALLPAIQRMMRCAKAARLDEAVAENKRLRDALHKIESMLPHTSTWDDDFYGHFSERCAKCMCEHALKGEIL